MSQKTMRKKGKTGTREERSPARNVFLTLTLVPLVIGVLLIGAWALDIEIIPGPQAQVVVGVLFFLLGFAASNLLMRRWRLAAGWALLIVADLAVLAWLQLWAQVVAIGLGLIGLGLLAVEFYRQYRQNNASGEQS
jgi:hypothetical protein